MLHRLGILQYRGASEPAADTGDMWFLELFGEALVLALDPALTRIRAWRAYRQLYSVAERKEHKRQLAARPPLR